MSVDVIVPMGTLLEVAAEYTYTRTQNTMTAFLIGCTADCSEASCLGRNQCDLSCSFAAVPFGSSFLSFPFLSCSDLLRDRVTWLAGLPSMAMMVDIEQRKASQSEVEKCHAARHASSVSSSGNAAPLWLAGRC